MWNKPNSPNEESAGDPYAREQTRMIEQQLRPRGIVAHQVLNAMRNVPRHLFVAHEYAPRAYADEALPSSDGQTISQPYMVGVMTQELDLHPGQKVLELGTGTGYQTAVLSQIVGDEGAVYTIEVVAPLGEAGRRRLDAMGIRNIHFYIGDGSAGWPGAAAEMFDRILVTAGAPDVPKPLVEQLKVGGILVLPVGRGATQTLVRIKRHKDRLEQTEILGCRFVPLLGQFAWDDEEYRRMRIAED